MTQVPPDEIQYDAETTQGSDRQLSPFQAETHLYTSKPLNLDNGMGRKQGLDLCWFG